MNKRGFAVTTMLYGLTVMGFLIVILLMSIMSNNRVNTKDIVNNIEKDMNSHTATSKNGNIQ